MTYELPTPPKGVRIDKYVEKFNILFEKLKASNFGDLKSFDAFMLGICKDCEVYLERELGVNFPSIIPVTFFYNKEEYVSTLKKLDIIFGRTRLYTSALVVNLGTGANIFINVQDYFKGKPIDFIVNLCIAFIEELIHITDPTKTETQIHDTVCSMIEGFLEVKLTDEIKNRRIRYSKEIDEIK